MTTKRLEIAKSPVLIANRGEIAIRVMRTARTMGMNTVAVYSQADRDALFVTVADEAICIGGSHPAESYLDQDKIIAAAKQTGANAIHPGYGFLSENPALPRACEKYGLTVMSHAFGSGGQPITGCGWPSFYDSSKAKNVLERVDNSHGMRRVETVCKRCGAHLGHVFEGEGFKTPTDRRFCINGVALKFVAKGGQAPKLLEPESAEVQKKKDEVAKEGGEAPKK